jgi:methionyl-tRNA formyltransferase
MKLVIVTQSAPMYLPAFLDELLTRLALSGHQIEGIVALAPTFKNTFWQEARSRLAYYGVVDFIRMTAHVAANVVRARLPGAGGYSVKNVIARHNVERLATSSVNSPELGALIERRGVDVVLSIAAPQIFRQRLLEAPRHGCVNYHMGLLPRYRGRQPLFWAMLHDEPEVGLSVHEMDSELDNGPILVQDTIRVAPDDSLHRLYLRCVARGPALVAQAIDRLAADDPERLPNDAAQASTFSFPDREAVRLFRARGKRFF